MVDEWCAKPGNRPRAVPDHLEFLVSAPVPKKVQKGGIRHNGRDYIAPKLGALVGECVEGREGPRSAGRVAVFETEGRGGGFICLAVDAEMEGVDRAAIAMRAKALQKEADAQKREAARVITKLTKPAAVLRDILDSRETSNVAVLQRFDYSGGGPALAELARAGEADRAAGEALRVKAPKPAGARKPAGAAQMDAAAMAAAARLFDASGAASAAAETWEEPPEARFARLLRGGAHGPGDADFFGYFSQLPAARGIALAVEAAAAAC
jgi:hypothetical protein